MAVQTDDKKLDGKGLSTLWGIIKNLFDSIVIPKKTSDLTNDSNFVSDSSYVHTDNNYTTNEKNKLDGIASGAEVNVQSDWSATSGDAFIKNKPNIPTAVAVKGDAETNYRTGNVNITPANIGLGNVGNFKAVSTVASQGLTDTEKSNARANIGAASSSDLTSLAARVTTNETNIAANKTAIEINAANIANNKTAIENNISDITALATKVSNTYTKEDTDTLLNKKADKTELSTVATSGSYNDLTNKPTIPAAASNGTYTVKTLVGSTTTNVSDFTANQSSADDVTFVQGTNVTITPDATNRKITIAAKDTTYSNATTSAAGLMSADDKTKLNGIATGATNVSSSTVSGWGFTKNTGTVTKVSTGAGLTGGDISTTGTVKANLVDETKNSASSTKSSTSTVGGLYAIELDKDGKLAVRVPWENSTYTGRNFLFKNSSGSTLDTYTPLTGDAKALQAGSNITMSASSNVVTISATDTTYTIGTGDSNGQIKVTPSSGSAYNVSVKGLGSNAYSSTSYLPLSGGDMHGDIRFINGGIIMKSNDGTIANAFRLYFLDKTLYYNATASGGSSIGLYWGLSSDSHKYFLFQVASTSNWYNTFDFIISNERTSKELFRITYSGDIGVGVSSPSYKLHVNGAVGATAFTNTSDIRNKDFISDTSMSIEQIANAPSFLFRWKTGDDRNVHAGSSAQYWNTVLPEIITAANDQQRTLSMQYDVIALLSSITIAREVVDDKERIRQLEERVKELESKLEN